MVTTDTHDLEVEVRHDEDRHVMEIYVTRPHDVGNMIDSYGGWSALEIPLAILPCVVYNAIYDMMEHDVLLDLQQRIFGEAE